MAKILLFCLRESWRKRLNYSEIIDLMLEMFYLIMIFIQFLLQGNGLASISRRLCRTIPLLVFSWWGTPQCTFHPNFGECRKQAVVGGLFKYRAVPYYIHFNKWARKSHRWREAMSSRTSSTIRSKVTEGLCVDRKEMFLV